MKKIILWILFLLESVGLFFLWESSKMLKEIEIINDTSPFRAQGHVFSSVPIYLWFGALLIAFVSVIALLYLLYSVIRYKDTLENRKLVLFSIASTIIYLFIIVVYFFY